MLDFLGECGQCSANHWHPFAFAEPILGVSCGECRAREWVGFTPDEWVEYVIPVTHQT